jgi:hypothetical protein
MHRLGSRVVIFSDSLEQRLPIGAVAYVIAFDKNPDTVFDYIVRIPHLAKNVLVSRHDLISEAEWLHHEAERVQRALLIDYALATRNRALFDRLTARHSPI